MISTTSDGVFVFNLSSGLHSSIRFQKLIQKLLQQTGSGNPNVPLHSNILQLLLGAPPRPDEKSNPTSRFRASYHLDYPRLPPVGETLEASEWTSADSFSLWRSIGSLEMSELPRKVTGWFSQNLLEGRSKGRGRKCILFVLFGAEVFAL